MEETVEYAHATGLLSGIWLLVAIPLASAAVLLLLGKRADKWGHWLGVLSVAASFVLGLIDVLQPARTGRQPLGGAEPVRLHLGRQPARRLRAAVRPAVRRVRAADHRRRLADPPLRGRLHGARPGPAEVLRLLQPLRRRDAAAGPRQQLRDALLRLGGRRSGVVPADLVLVHPAVGGDRRQEGVPDEPGRRRRPGDRHLPDVRHARHHQLRRRCSTASARCPPAPY